MAKSNKPVVESAFSFEELAEQLVIESGGVTELAKMIVAGAQDTQSAFTREKFITLIARIMKQAMPRQQASDSLTDDEIDRALNAEITRHFVSMDEETYRVAISEIQKVRAGKTATSGEGPEANRESVPADNTGGDDRSGEPQSEQRDSPLQAAATSAEDWAAAIDREVESGERSAAP